MSFQMSELARGLESQLATRAGLLADGAKPLGWKAGFGAPEWLTKLGTEGPLVGFLTDATLIPDGTTVDISTWTRGVAEPEIAVHLGADLEPPLDEDTTRAAIASIGPAIELADIDPPPESVEGILTGNIFHRGVILGAPDPARAGADLGGLEARIRPEGQEEIRTDQLEILTGNVVHVVTHLASQLAAHGVIMRSGEVVICGSVVPPITLSPGTKMEFELSPMPAISVQTAPDGFTSS
jgi:2-keto-4-pentenoate hydratase